VRLLGLAWFAVMLDEDDVYAGLAGGRQQDRDIADDALCLKGPTGDRRFLDIYNDQGRTTVR
jgi:hypothetical protein